MSRHLQTRLISGVLLFLLAAINCIWWSGAIAYNAAPDEYEHCKTQRFIAQFGRLPRPEDPGFGIHLLDSSTKQPIYPVFDQSGSRLLFSQDDPLYANHSYEVRQPYIWTPQLAHMLAGLLMRALGNSDSLFASRLFNALCVAGAALMTYLAGLSIRGVRWELALLSGLAAALWPQITFIGAYANDDAFSVLAVSALLAICCRIERDGLTSRNALWLGLGLGIGLLSKLYVYALFPLVGLWLLQRLRVEGRKTVGPLGLTALVAVATGGWWFVRNALLFHGDFMGRRTLFEQVQRFNAALPQELAALTHKLYDDSLFQLGVPLIEFPLLRWLKISLVSFYGMFGWMNKLLHPALYWLAYIATALALVALVIALLRKNERARLPLAVRLFGLPYLGLLLALSIYNSYRVDLQPQGRYLLSSVPALMLLCFAGTATLPGRAGRIAPFALIGLYFALNLVARLVFL